MYANNDHEYLNTLL